MRTIEFIGMAAGDRECFCWDVDEATYKRICGDHAHAMEVEYNKTRYGGPRNIWRIYPSDLIAHLGVIGDNRPMTFTFGYDDEGSDD